MLKLKKYLIDNLLLSESAELDIDLYYRAEKILDKLVQKIKKEPGKDTYSVNDGIKTFNFTYCNIDASGKANSKSAIPSELNNNFEIKLNEYYKNIDYNNVNHLYSIYNFEKICIHEIIHFFNYVKMYNTYTEKIIYKIKKELLSNTFNYEHIVYFIIGDDISDDVIYSNTIFTKENTNYTENDIDENDDDEIEADLEEYVNISKDVLKKCIIKTLDTYNNIDKTDFYYLYKWFNIFNDILIKNIKKQKTKKNSYHIERLLNSYLITDKKILLLIFTEYYLYFNYNIRKNYDPKQSHIHNKYYYEHSIELDTRFKDKFKMLISYINHSKILYSIFGIIPISFKNVWEYFENLFNSSKYIMSESVKKRYKKRLYEFYNEYHKTDILKKEISKIDNEYINLLNYLSTFNVTNISINNTTNIIDDDKTIITSNIYDIVITFIYNNTDITVNIKYNISDKKYSFKFISSNINNYYISFIKDNNTFIENFDKAFNKIKKQLDV